MMYSNSNVFNPFEIIVGTYEQYVLGYRVDNIVNEYKVEKTFATHGHLASVRSVATNKNYLASSGADDSVLLYDMKQRIQSGKLTHHDDTVNCVAFTPDASHLFTCSNDGTITAIRCGNWQLEKHWRKPHKGLAVNALVIHPTGKLALSTGADGVLRTWNLVKGRQAYATNLIPRLKLDAKNITVLKWSPNGEKYLLVSNQTIDIYSVELAGVDKEIKLDSKVICVEFLNDNLIAVGLENGQVKLYDLMKNTEAVHTVAHDIRVKCMACLGNLLITASSSGEIKLWKYSENTIDMLKSINCGARITCLCLAMIHETVGQREKPKLELEYQIKPKSHMRTHEEVIIEDESLDNWTVTDISTNDKFKSKTKKRTKVLEENEYTKKSKITNNQLDTSKRKRSVVVEIGNTENKSLKNSNKKKKISDLNIPERKRRKNLETIVPCKKKKTSQDDRPSNNVHKKYNNSLVSENITVSKKRKKQSNFVEEDNNNCTIPNYEKSKVKKKFPKVVENVLMTSKSQPVPKTPKKLFKNKNKKERK